MKMLKNVLAGRILTSIIVIFILSWITLLSSCTAYVRTPRHVRTDVVIQGQIRNDDNGRENNRNWRKEKREKREKREHRDND